MKTTEKPNRKLLPVGREGLEEGVEIIGDLVIEEYYEFWDFSIYSFWSVFELYCFYYVLHWDKSIGSRGTAQVYYTYWVWRNWKGVDVKVIGYDLVGSFNSSSLQHEMINILNIHLMI